MALTTTTTTTAIEALRAQGVAGHVARRLATTETPDLIGAWCRYSERHERMGPGALINGIRSGEHPPAPPSPRRGDRRPATTAEIVTWLKAKLPEVCDPEPHDAAVLLVQQLHFRFGRGSITARKHGPLIRAAVKGAQAQEDRER